MRKLLIEFKLNRYLADSESDLNGYENVATDDYTKELGGKPKKYGGMYVHGSIACFFDLFGTGKKHEPK